MPIIEKIKSAAGKALLKSSKNLKGEDKLKWKDVEYATKERPRVVAKKTETITKKGTFTREKVRVGGKKTVDNKYFTPKNKMNFGPF
jgi:hypothetical protein